MGASQMYSQANLSCLALLLSILGTLSLFMDVAVSISPTPANSSKAKESQDSELAAFLLDLVALEPHIVFTGQ
jgi:hypothetical protein